MFFFFLGYGPCYHLLNSRSGWVAMGHVIIGSFVFLMDVSLVRSVVVLVVFG